MKISTKHKTESMIIMQRNMLFFLSILLLLTTIASTSIALRNKKPYFLQGSRGIARYLSSAVARGVSRAPDIESIGIFYRTKRAATTAVGISIIYLFPKQGTQKTGA